ncbi:LysR family transcriptional regulator [Citrobacter freundii]|uniref:helix-turn-helix domain-containing protein n=1 Tax=Citrobacter freundii TaxID=546 RepID=UPI0015EF52E7|nr:LysR family transcriptional regulator [Citrobacter freundii]
MVSIYGLKDIDLKSIISFIVTMETGSQYNASRLLGCSVATISHNIKRTQLYCGAPLFIREGRRLTPTKDAVLLKAELKSCLLQLSSVLCKGNE